MDNINNFEVIGGKVTVDQAAWMVKKSSQAIYNAINAGRLTAEVTERSGKKIKLVQVVDLEKLYQKLRVPKNNDKNGETIITNAQKPSSNNIDSNKYIEMMEARYKKQIEQYEEEVEYLRKAHEKSQETTHKITLMLEDKSKQTGGDDGWKNSIKSLESRIANQEKVAKEKEGLEEKIKKENKELKSKLIEQQKEMENQEKSLKEAKAAELKIKEEEYEAAQTWVSKMFGKKKKAE